MLKLYLFFNNVIRKTWSSTVFFVIFRSTNTLDNMTSRIGKIALDKTLFLCCDVQDRFRSLIHNFPSVLYVAHTMNKASQTLKIPLVVTEQYPSTLRQDY
jgi:hypothetical protein